MNDFVTAHEMHFEKAAFMRSTMNQQDFQFFIMVLRMSSMYSVLLFDINGDVQYVQYVKENL